MFNLSLNFFTSVVGGIVINVLQFMIFLELYNDFEFITIFVILLFLSLWLFCNSPFLWSCITWYIFWDSPHVVSFHLYFLQIQMVMPCHLIGLNIVARFFNDMFYVSSTPCHYAHVFIMALHNNTFVFLKTIIVNDNEMCITLNYFQTIIFHDNVKYNTLIFYKS